MNRSADEVRIPVRSGSRVGIPSAIERIVGVGVDVVDVRRVRDAIGRFGAERYLARIGEPTMGGNALGSKAGRLAQRAAYVFAVKESVVKALTMDTSGPWNWADIALVTDDEASPRALRVVAILARGQVAEQARCSGVSRLALAGSIRRDVAVVYALALTDQPVLPRS